MLKRHKVPNRNMIVDTRTHPRARPGDTQGYIRGHRRVYQAVSKGAPGDIQECTRWNSKEDTSRHPGSAPGDYRAWKSRQPRVPESITESARADSRVSLSRLQSEPEVTTRVHESTTRVPKSKARRSQVGYKRAQADYKEGTS